MTYQLRCAYVSSLWKEHRSKVFELAFQWRDFVETRHQQLLSILSCRSFIIHLSFYHISNCCYNSVSMCHVPIWCLDASSWLFAHVHYLSSLWMIICIFSFLSILSSCWWCLKLNLLSYLPSLLNSSLYQVIPLQIVHLIM